MKISFDFDGVLNAIGYAPDLMQTPGPEPRADIEPVLKQLQTDGHTLYVLSARQGIMGESMIKVLYDWKLMQYFSRVKFGVWEKAEWCKKHGVYVHIDDHPDIVSQFVGMPTGVYHFNADRDTFYDIHASLKELAKYAQELPTALDVSLAHSGQLPHPVASAEPSKTGRPGRVYPVSRSELRQLRVEGLPLFYEYPPAELNKTEGKKS